jgi:adenylate cyclase
MALEIERKYLVDHVKWSCLDKPKGEVYRQGYLLTAPDKTIRVRMTPDKAFFTIKGSNVGAVRHEFEYEIPLDDAQALLDQFAVAELSKRRFKIEKAGKVWEVDEFHGANHGLIVAEIELDHEHEVFELPDWVVAEVTGQEQYYNSSLSQRPYSTW